MATLAAHESAPFFIGMNISYSWLSSYLSSCPSAPETAEALTACGLEVEGISTWHSVGGGLQGLFVGEVLTCAKHPDADRLSLTTVSVGGAAPLSIVCGAPNVAAGQKVVVATVGALLHPMEGEPLEIKKSKIRGAVSEGMLCAEDEIGIGSSHNGILVLPADAPVGMPVADYLKVVQDLVLEIGLTPNRVDASSHLGVARDLVALDWERPAGEARSLVLPPTLPLPSGAHSFEVAVQADAAQRYLTLVLDGLTNGPSPEWMQHRLQAIGLRPINLVVDITNFVLWECGQPLHAFDADKIAGGKLDVRFAKAGESIILLDGKSIALHAEDVVIADAQQALCLAGVYGGANSGVTETTRRIVLESACFWPTRVRRTSARHGIKTDSSFRFERGTDPGMCQWAMERAAYLLCSLGGAHVSGQIRAVEAESIQPVTLSYRIKKAFDLIGYTLPTNDLLRILEGLGIELLEQSEEAFLLRIPSAKVDVKREADVTEEVLRIYGYNRVPLPGKVSVNTHMQAPQMGERLQQLASEWLVAQGFLEIMAMSLQGAAQLAQAEVQGAGQPIGLLNPLSSELNVLRPSMLPGGLQTIAHNRNRQRPDGLYFEFGKVYGQSPETQSIVEEPMLALWAAGKRMPETWMQASAPSNPFVLKGLAERLFKRLNVSFETSIRSDASWQGEVLEYTSSGMLLARIGWVGQAARKAYGVKESVAYAEVHWPALMKSAGTTPRFAELPKYPEVRRDLALVVDHQVTYNALADLARKTEKRWLKNINLFDVYQGDKLPAGKKSYAIGFTLYNPEATLTDQEIEQVVSKLLNAFRKEVGAELRG